MDIKKLNDEKDLFAIENKIRMKLILEKISLIVWNWRGTDVIVEAYFINATPSCGNLLLHP